MRFALPLGLPRGLCLDCGPSQAEDPWTDRSDDEKESAVSCSSSRRKKEKNTQQLHIFGFQEYVLARQCSGQSDAIKNRKKEKANTFAAFWAQIKIVPS